VIDVFGDEVATKVCNYCERELPISDFALEHKSGKKIKPRCRSCEKTVGRQMAGIRKTIPKPESDHRCPICLSNEDDIRKNIQYVNRNNVGVWSLDHDHKTGKFRDWICNKCNLALGNFSDDLPRLERAVEYLRRFL
jgi:Zn finger protein HypA/HybF involved in hydrogenase expression